MTDGLETVSAWASHGGRQLVLCHDDEAFDMGRGAGFYLDATQEPWSRHFRMRTYVETELPRILADAYPVDLARQAITGHSMGGHGALTIALRDPGRFRSVSAFAPIVAPTQVPWGRKAFAAYLGPDAADWRRHDAVALVEDMDRDAAAAVPPILVDQGEDEQFLAEQLRPDLLRDACGAKGIDLALRIGPGDHSYYTISTHMHDHVAWHARHLAAGATPPG